jgi:antitoxin component of MazEF toxin-antitoxin module
MKAQMIKWGQGLAVLIPKPAAEAAMLKEGDSLEIEVSEGQIILHRIGRIPCLTELIAEITPEHRYGEISFGTEIGKEKIEW